MKMKNNLNVYCPVNAATGYGITSTNTSLSLNKLVDVALFHISGQMSVDNESQKEHVTKMLNRLKEYDKNAPCLKIWHQHDLASRVGVGDYYVMPFFELDKLHEAEVYQINQADGIFTPSKWSKKVLEDNGVTIPVYVAPLGVNLDIFNTKQLKVENEEYTFLHVGKWEKRKSQDFLLEAFGKAFTPEDNVCLWLVPHNPFLNQDQVKEWHKLVEDNPMTSKITVFDRLPNQNTVSEIMDKADCGVFLSRAEGWNNEIPEMMAMNRPIIATNYSAHTEYCTNKNSFLVDVDETEPADDGMWFRGQGNWAKLGEKQLEQTVEHMRFVYNNNVYTNPNGVETARLYSWDNTASVIHQTLLENNSYNVKT